MSKYNYYRVPFYLDALTEKIINSKMKAAGVETFEDYFELVLSESVKNIKIKSGKNSTTIKAKGFNKNVNKKRNDLIESLSVNFSCSKSSVIKTLLVSFDTTSPSLI